MKDKQLNLFDFYDYRTLIRGVIELRGEERGYHKRLAAAAGCHTSYLSQVLNSHIQLTPDQAAGMARFWGFSAQEADYFLCLVMLDRSSTPALKEFLETRLAALREENNVLSRRIKNRPSKLALEDQVLYYSAWYYAAIHMMITVPRLRKPAEIAQRLALPTDLVERTLNQLETMGVVQRDEGGYAPTNKVVHIGTDSPLNATNHAHWRQVATHRIFENRPGEVHYSAVYSLSQADLVKLREELLQLMERSRQIVGPSKEETVGIMILDLFEM